MKFILLLLLFLITIFNIKAEDFTVADYFDYVEDTDSIEWEDHFFNLRWSQFNPSGKTDIDGILEGRSLIVIFNGDGEEFAIENTFCNHSLVQGDFDIDMRVKPFLDDPTGEGGFFELGGIFNLYDSGDTAIRIVLKDRNLYYQVIHNGEWLVQGTTAANLIPVANFTLRIKRDDSIVFFMVNGQVVAQVEDLRSIDRYTIIAESGESYFSFAILETDMFVAGKRLVFNSDSCEAVEDPNDDAFPMSEFFDDFEDGDSITPNSAILVNGSYVFSEGDINHLARFTDPPNSAVFDSIIQGGLFISGSALERAVLSFNCATKIGDKDEEYEIEIRVIDISAHVDGIEESYNVRASFGIYLYSTNFGSPKADYAIIKYEPYEQKFHLFIKDKELQEVDYGVIDVANGVIINVKRDINLGQIWTVNGNHIVTHTSSYSHKLGQLRYLKYEYYPSLSFGTNPGSKTTRIKHSLDYIKVKQDGRYIYRNSREDCVLATGGQGSDDDDDPTQDPNYPDCIDTTGDGILDTRPEWTDADGNFHPAEPCDDDDDSNDPNYPDCIDTTGDGILDTRPEWTDEDGVFHPAEPCVSDDDDDDDTDDPNFPPCEDTTGDGIPDTRPPWTDEDGVYHPSEPCTDPNLDPPPIGGPTTGCGQSTDIVGAIDCYRLLLENFIGDVKFNPNGDIVFLYNFNFTFLGQNIKHDFNINFNDELGKLNAVKSVIRSIIFFFFLIVLVQNIFVTIRNR